LNSRLYKIPATKTVAKANNVGEKNQPKAAKEK
jgi:hypothetical protein